MHRKDMLNILREISISMIEQIPLVSKETFTVKATQSYISSSKVAMLIDICSDVFNFSVAI